MHFRLLYLVICVLSYRFSSAQQLVSRGKTITASNQHQDWDIGRAVDGNTNRGAHTCKCCAATTQQLNPWYKLDLGQQYVIHSISVLGRGGPGDRGNPVGYGHTLKQMEIKLGRYDWNGPILTNNTPDVYVYNYTLPTPQEGRYLTLTLRGMKQFFAICELSVYAVCDGNTYGQNCTSKCGRCKNDEPCDTVDGSCKDCRTGYKHPLCKDCIGGRYGSGCQEICGKCENNEPCDTRTGTCSSCRTGYKPNLCQDCEDGKYGANCENICGRCKNGKHCDTRNGRCSECMTGYIPPLCQDCEDGKYGANCENTCGRCKNGKHCDTRNGRCSECMTGYKPPLCQDCEDGKYGANCENTCGRCKNGKHCDTRNGRCSECMTGYIPPLCQDCEDGKYGANCENTCGRCKNGKHCDTRNGRCSECMTGYIPPLCQECADFYYGYDCSQRCFCVNGPCNKATGICPAGGCTDGYKGYTCNTPCGYGKYGQNCEEDCGSCYSEVTCDRFNGRCQQCAPGYMGVQCKQLCRNGTYGQGCRETCGQCYNNEFCNRVDGHCTRCAAGYKGVDCKKECADFYYGNTCSQRCFCANGPCDKATGICPTGRCTKGYKGDECNTPCGYGKYGQNCEEDCGSCYSEVTCDRFNGRCQQCAPGYMGVQCKQLCRNGTYGQGCRETCGQCYNNEFCNRVDGHCTRCAAGYKGVDCKKDCDSRTFGLNCSQECGQCLNSTQCNKVNGSCPSGCDLGFKGALCNAMCGKGKYGENCTNDCGYCYQEETCNALTGRCHTNCSEGYTGIYCKTACPDDKYGRNCVSTCGNCLNQTICSKDTGSCDTGCELGYKPPLCQQECENGTFGLGCNEECGKCLDGEACDKRNGTCSKCEPKYIEPLCTVLRQVIPPADPNPSPAPIIGAVVGVLALVVIVIVAVVFYKRRQNEKYARPAKPAIPSLADIDENQTNGISTAQKEQPKVQIKTEQASTSKNPDEQKNKDEEDIYYAFLSKKTDLKICQLWDYIQLKKRDDSLLFYQEYNRLPGELKHPCDEAKKAKNAGKNRYRGLYAYDHTRVPLAIEEAGEGDYINASFIHGFEKQKKFIASQGPTENMRTDFWRMVWQQKSKSIVMLTNLTELGTEKCILYWPGAGEVTYGNITVRHVSEEVTVDFTIRQFEIFKCDENNRLPVTQYHFQAWPDKSTPDSTWCLVKFWLRITQDTANIADSGPIVVHCSAGIGRTGTFIALDNAYNQAKLEGTVRILAMVTSIREQRVKMVQTRDQYVYLHEAVADALLFGTHFVWSGQFEELYEYVIDVPPKSRISRLQTQFNLIVESVEDKRNVHTTLEETDNEYSNVFIHGKLQQQVSVDEYRPKSKSQKYVREVGGLILQNHEEKGVFIICKSPTESYAAEFWSLVQEQNIKTIVSLSPCEDGITVSHFQYKNWNFGENVPKDASSMVQFVEAVLDRQRRLSDTEPVLVYCNDGVKQSGLLCVLLSEINRINRAGGHINIIQTVKMMKERNIDIIGNFDQYRYIYDVILARLHESTYQNQ